MPIAVPIAPVRARFGAAPRSSCEFGTRLKLMLGSTEYLIMWRRLLLNHSAAQTAALWTIGLGCGWYAVASYSALAGCLVAGVTGLIHASMHIVHRKHLDGANPDDLGVSAPTNRATVSERTQPVGLLRIRLKPDLESVILAGRTIRRIVGPDAPVVSTGQGEFTVVVAGQNLGGQEALAWNIRTAIDDPMRLPAGQTSIVLSVDSVTSTKHSKWVHSLLDQSTTDSETETSLDEQPLAA